MGRNCPECDRLWEQFVAATHAHLKLLDRQQAAVIKHDSAALAELRRPVAESAVNRQSARHAFREHAETHGDAVPLIL
jgi:hypothetical protein